MKIINFKTKNKTLLVNEQQNSYQNLKICYICKEKFEDKHATDKKYCKIREDCHYTGEYIGLGHIICIIKYSVPEEIRIVFCNGSNCYYHFIIKELAKEFGKLKNLKHWKINNLYSSNKKRSYKKL